MDIFSQQAIDELVAAAVASSRLRVVQLQTARGLVDLYASFLQAGNKKTNSEGADWAYIGGSRSKSPTLGHLLWGRVVFQEWLYCLRECP